LTKKLLLIDFENVQEIGDLSKVPGSFHIVVFVGAHQKKFSADLVIKNQNLGSRLEWKQIEGNGKNALDFCIAYELGEFFKAYDLRDVSRKGEAQPECVILSGDKGFDPLLVGLKKKGRNCKRVKSLQELLNESRSSI
jgi:hypothetical protein